MATLLWIIAVIAVITLIARYNEDDGLFWKLFIAFVGAFAAGSAVKTMIADDNKEKVVMIEKAPTQVLQSTPCNAYSLADVSLAATKREKSPKPVSKDSLINQNDSLLSKVTKYARGQPFILDYFDTS
jgi:hypothetical protein